MFTETRQEAILSILKKKKAVKVQELAQTLYVSGATIRRDLSQMEKAGMIKRSHGGAVIFDSLNEEMSALIREQENADKKKLIAEIACRLIKSNDTIFMDSSSTTRMTAPLLQRFRHITVITNGLKHAMLLTEKTSARVGVPNGFINSHSNSILGSDSIEYISKLNANVALISCAGLTLRNGPTEASLEQAKIKGAMLAHAATKILLCDSSKFGTIYMCKTCGIENLDYIITDKKPDIEFEDTARSQSCQILYPK